MSFRQEENDYGGKLEMQRNWQISGINISKHKLHIKTVIQSWLYPLKRPRKNGQCSISEYPQLWDSGIEIRISNLKKPKCIGKMGQEMYNMNLYHLVTAKSREALQENDRQRHYSSQEKKKVPDSLGEAEKPIIQGDRSKCCFWPFI